MKDGNDLPGDKGEGALEGLCSAGGGPCEPSAPSYDSMLADGPGPTAKGDAGEEDDEEALPPFITHVVRTTDTLQGICLRYKVTVREVKRHNDFPKVREAVS